MRTNIRRVSPEDNEGGEDEGRREPEPITGVEGYVLEGDEDEHNRLVIFDSKNPLAWIISDWFGRPIDARTPDDGSDDEGPSTDEE